MDLDRALLQQPTRQLPEQLPKLIILRLPWDLLVRELEVLAKDRIPKRESALHLRIDGRDKGRVHGEERGVHAAPGAHGPDGDGNGVALGDAVEDQSELVLRQRLD